MSKSTLKAAVKNSKLFYALYFYLGSFLLRFVGLFIKTDPNLILFSSYGGRRYDDSPRVLYEYLLSHPASPDHKYVWAFTNPNDYPNVPNSIPIDTIQFYITALRSGYWITNSSISRGLDFKKKTTKNILFQHGMAGIKRIATDVLQSKHIFVTAFHEQFDHVFIEGKKELPILTKVWKLPENVFHQIGLPRNDNLANVDSDTVTRIRHSLNIPDDKKIILYAPTFRDYDKAPNGQSALHIPIDFQKWNRTLGKEYILIVTAHYEVAKLLDSVPGTGFAINAFGYPNINDLLIISDILISDYSSIVFDYSILERPILCYGYDYDKYLVTRGTYMDIEKLFFNGVIRDEDQLLSIISSMDYQKHCNYTRDYIKNEYIAAYGNAAQKAAAIIFGHP